MVVVTGASSGIGRACAIELAARGARVVLVGRHQATLDQTMALMAGGGHHVLLLDLEALDRIGPEIRRTGKALGPLYGLCHAAGLAATEPLGAMTAESLQSLLAVNLLAGLELARVVTRRDVMSVEGGSLLFVSSVYANRGVAAETGYSAAKGAMASAARAMAVELARRRIRVNSVAPGMVKTRMTDTALAQLTPQQVAAIDRRHLLGVGTPEDVARAAAFLLSPQASWITGVDLAVDGGYSAQ